MSESLDPAPPASVPDELLSRITLLRANAAEIEALTGAHVTDLRSAREAAKSLLTRGVEAVITEAGSEGNLLVWHDGEEWLPRLPVESVDATGAGDAFSAAVAVALAEGHSYVAAGWFGSGAAALATTQLGAQALPRRAELETYLSKVRRAQPSESDRR